VCVCVSVHGKTAPVSCRTVSNSVDFPKQTRPRIRPADTCLVHREQEDAINWM
jgi:hypothetical protein